MQPGAKVSRSRFNGEKDLIYVILGCKICGRIRIDISYPRNGGNIDESIDGIIGLLPSAREG